MGPYGNRLSFQVSIFSPSIFFLFNSLITTHSSVWELFFFPNIWKILGCYWNWVIVVCMYMNYQEIMSRILLVLRFNCVTYYGEIAINQLHSRYLLRNATSSLLAIHQLELLHLTYQWQNSVQYVLQIILLLCHVLLWYSGMKSCI